MKEKFSFFRASLLFAWVWAVHSQGVSSDYVIQNRSMPKPKVVVGKSDQSISCATFIDLSTKDLLSLGQYRLFLRFSDSIHSKTFWFLTLAPSSHLQSNFSGRKDRSSSEEDLFVLVHIKYSNFREFESWHKRKSHFHSALASQYSSCFAPSWHAIFVISKISVLSYLLSVTSDTIWFIWKSWLKE